MPPVKTLLTLLALACLSVPLSAQDKHLFILAGQSNMARMKPQVSFKPAVEAAFGAENVSVVHKAKPGQPIRNWLADWQVDGFEVKDPSKLGSLYGPLLSNCEAALKKDDFSTVTFIWMQGERDAKDGLAAHYEASFNQLLTKLKTDLEIDHMNVVIGRICDWHGGANYEDWERLRDLQVSMAEAKTDWDWVDCDDLNTVTNKKGKVVEDLHYSKEGYKILGERFAAKAIALIEADTAK